MIRCQHMGFHYRPEQPILSGVNLHLEPGSFTFITGPSGAGKTSFLGLLSLLQTPTEGTLELLGEDATLLPREALPELRRKIGTVFQEFELLDHLTVAENVGLPLKMQGESNKMIIEKVDELLSWVGLEGLGNAKPPILSGGQKQRVAIARAVINQPKLIIADEPTGNLDPELSMRILYLFRALNKIGTTVVFATHDESLMEHFDYPVLYIRDGKISRSRRP